MPFLVLATGGEVIYHLLVDCCFVLILPCDLRERKSGKAISVFSFASYCYVMAHLIRRRGRRPLFIRQWGKLQQKSREKKLYSAETSSIVLESNKIKHFYTNLQI